MLLFLLCGNVHWGKCCEFCPRLALLPQFETLSIEKKEAYVEKKTTDKFSDVLIGKACNNMTVF